ncbi:MAG: hydrogenase [Desulfobulbaceae bacterium]|jgi:Ni,Fe-hydrogenase III small subunit|nr:hydrogenase [Desulfobulbaceae bacterium]
MLKIIGTRLNQGMRTTPWPKKPVTLAASYRGLPRLNDQCDAAIIGQCAEQCPQQAIDAAAKTIDLGRCVFCGDCAGDFVRFTNDFRLGCAARSDLITAGDLPDLASRAKEQWRKLFGRSLQIRQVSAGGCNACEADTNVLGTPFFDLSRFGIDFVASPRHADALHVTGPISKNMKSALLDTYAAMPEPKAVIAAGCCAISGGPFYGSEEIIGDLNSLIPVDLYIPGCPPHPMSTLHALVTFFKGRAER